MSLEESRIVNINQLQTYSDDLNRHAMQFEWSIVLNGEVRNGLASILSDQSPICKHIINLENLKEGKWPPRV